MEDSESYSHTLAVAIPTVGRTTPLRRCLRALSAQSHPVDAVLIGDANNDGRAQDVVIEFDNHLPVRVYDRPETESLPGTRNALLERTSADIISYLDDDTEPAPTWSKALLEGYAHGSAPVAVGGPALTVNKQGEPTLSLSRAPENQNHFNKYGEVEGIWYRWVPPSPVSTDLLMGANMSFKRKPLDAVGGFDSAYGGHAWGEEFPPMIQLKRQGKTLLYHPEARVKHYEATSGGTRRTNQLRERRYWVGRLQIRMRWHYFRETFWGGLARLLIWTQHLPVPVWRLLLAGITERDPSHLWQLKGYVDGLRYETGLHLP